MPFALQNQFPELSPETLQAAMLDAWEQHKTEFADQPDVVPTLTLFDPNKPEESVVIFPVAGRSTFTGGAVRFVRVSDGQPGTTADLHRRPSTQQTELYVTPTGETTSAEELQRRADYLTLSLLQRAVQTGVPQKPETPKRTSRINQALGRTAQG